MKYLLDTNACIALINGRAPRVRAQFQRVIDDGALVMASSIVAFELWYGVAKSMRQDANARSVEVFFAGPVSVLAFEPEDAKFAGRVRASLEVIGKAIGAYDILIAGQALRHQVRLVTSNGREFGRVRGLDWEDWARA